MAAAKEAPIEGGRRAIRAFGTVTSQRRPLPDYLVIGAKRGGTTSFYFALLEQPGTMPLFPAATYLPKRAHTKGVHYFDTNFHRGEAWYRSHFPTTAARRRASQDAGHPVTVGEASPYYLGHPLAAARAGALVPGAKIIALLRDPVERAFSHYRERRRNDAEPLSFEEALDVEAERTAGAEERLAADPTYYSAAHENHGYVAQGEYARALERWLAHYPREQLCVLPSEDFYTRPEHVLATVSAFLGLPGPTRLPADTVPLNAAPTGKMSTAVRQRLRDHFAPHNTALEELLDHRFPWQ